MQQISFGFLNVLLRITDSFNFLFRVKVINEFYHKISIKPWFKFECDTFDYGYYLAIYTTLINIATVFGTYTPLLYFLVAFLIFLKLYADGIKFTNIHGWDLEGNGKLFEVVIRRLIIGTIISHLMLMNQSFWNKQFVIFGVNTIAFIFTLTIYFLFRKFRRSNLFPLLKTVDKIPFDIPNSQDCANWIYRYTHPYYYVMGPAKAEVQMKELVADSHDENYQTYQDVAVRKRFNKPLNFGSNNKDAKELNLIVPSEENIELSDKRRTNSHQEDDSKSIGSALAPPHTSPNKLGAASSPHFFGKGSPSPKDVKEQNKTFIRPLPLADLVRDEEVVLPDTRVQSNLLDIPSGRKASANNSPCKEEGEDDMLKSPRGLEFQTKVKTRFRRDEEDLDPDEDSDLNSVLSEDPSRSPSHNPKKDVQSKRLSLVQEKVELEEEGINDEELGQLKNNSQICEISDIDVNPTSKQPKTSTGVFNSPNKPEVEAKMCSQDCSQRNIIESEKKIKLPSIEILPNVSSDPDDNGIVRPGITEVPDEPDLQRVSSIGLRQGFTATTKRETKES